MCIRDRHSYVDIPAVDTHLIPKIHVCYTIKLIAPFNFSKIFIYVQNLYGLYFSFTAFMCKSSYSPHFVPESSVNSFIDNLEILYLVVFIRV